jgi:hypothetical protein
VGLVNGVLLFEGISHDDGTNHEGNNDFPDEGTGVGVTHTEGVVGAGAIGVGEIMGFEGKEPD